MEKVNVIFRADASAQIGFGHVMRCISLAHMLKDVFRIKFVCSLISSELQKEIEDEKWELVNEDNDLFFSFISPSAIVVLDGYNFDLEYQRSIKARGAILICIDDLCEREFCADLIINPAPGVQIKEYRAESYTRFALGHEYALLRPAFLDQAKKERSIDGISGALVCFGGSDFLNITLRVLKVVSLFQQLTDIVVVTGSAYKFTDSITSYVETDIRMQHFQRVDERQMISLMLKCDLAIVPSSGILFEALACRNIVISGAYVENQRRIFEGFKNLNAIIATDFGNQESMSDVLNQVFERKKFSTIGIIDGKSKGRILKEFELLPRS